MTLHDAPRVTWRTHLSLALLALVYIFSFVDRQVIAILIEPIKREFGASDTQMGLLAKCCSQRLIFLPTHKEPRL
jgi:hypothetical protein